MSRLKKNIDRVVQLECNTVRNLKKVVACLIQTNGNCPHLEQAIVYRNHAIMVQNKEKP
jgi:hypothetical protein